MSMTLYTNGFLSLDGNDTGLGVSQVQEGTIVFKREKLDGSQKYEVVPMPHSRYALSHDKPASGAAGRAQFEADLRQLLGK